MPPSDVQTGDAAGQESAPAELGGYRVVELLGRGGMGEVWRGEREGPSGIRKRAAIKRMLPRLRRDPNVRERFLSEARTNAWLEHPNIVQVLDFGDTPEPFLVLEFVEGVTVAEILRDMIQSQTRLPAIAGAFIAAEVATGLDYAHRRRDEQGQPLEIIHRDVSPQNILVSLDGGVKITDFGVARAADNLVKTQEGMPIGKAGYMSPEQVSGHPYDARVDIFALGVTLWELVTLMPIVAHGDPDAAARAILSAPLRKPSEADPRLPPSVDQLIMPALARDPNARYATAGAFAQAIRSFVHTLSPGFDSNELVKILGRLMPSIAFRRAGMSIPAQSGPLANAYLGGHVEMPARAAQIAMPAFALPGSASPPSEPRAAAVAIADAPSKPAPEKPVPATRVPSAPVAAFRPVPAASSSPVSRGSGVVPVIALLVAVGASAAFASAMAYRSWARRHVAPSPTIVPAPRTPLSSPATGSVPVAPLVPDPSVGATPPLIQLPIIVAPIATDIPVVPMPVDTPPTVRPAIVPAAAPPVRPVDRQLTRAIQQDLAPLRGMIRACLGITDGSGARVRLTAYYDGGMNMVRDVDVRATGTSVGARERMCVLETVRNAVRVAPGSATTSVREDYEY